MSEPQQGTLPAGNIAIRAFLLLSTSAFLFASNHILGRAVEGLVPPIGLSFWRWVVAFLLMLPFTHRELWACRSIVYANWKRIAALTFFLAVMGNTGVYIALNWTTAINGGIVATVQPVVTFALSWIFFRTQATRWQAVGLALAISGVLTVLLRGDLRLLLTLDFNVGDLWMIVSVFGFALYSVLLRNAPKGISSMVLLSLIQFFGIVLLAPFYLWESIYVMPMRADLVTAGSVLWAGVMVGIVAIAVWNQGILYIGANKASAFGYLRTILVALLAILLLGEVLALHHIVAFALVVAGIYLVTGAKTKSG